MSRLVGLAVLLSGSLAAADTYVAPATKPTGYARKAAGKPPAFDEDRLAKFLMASRWEPVFETERAPDQVVPGIEFVPPGSRTPGAKVDVVKVAVGAIERRARTTIVAVNQSGYELRPCAQKPKHTCLYPRPELRFDAESGTAPTSAAASTSPRDCAALAKRVAELEARQAAEIERLQKQKQDMSKKLK